MLDENPPRTALDLFAEGVRYAWTINMSPFTVTVMIIFILLLIGAWIYLSASYRRKLENQSQWLQLLNFSYRKNLSPNQIRILEDFFFGLPLKVSLSLLEDWGEFRRLLAAYLNAISDVSNELKVKLMDRLFLPGTDAAQSIEKATDVKAGETCGLEINDKHYMGTVIETKENDLLVCIPNWGPPQGLEGKESKLYAYRPEVGGFLFSGSILSTKKDCVYFRHSGELESKNYFHMMVEQELPVKFMSWPQVDEHASSITTPAQEKNKELGIPLAKKNVFVYGSTSNISDRTLSFLFKTDADQKVFMENDQIVWEMTLLMPDDSKFICLGKIINLDHQYEKSGLFFFKYIDLTDKDRDRLLQWIQANHPVKEKLTI